jgi:hypothetical protein
MLKCIVYGLKKKLKLNRDLEIGTSKRVIGIQLISTPWPIRGEGIHSIDGPDGAITDPSKMLQVATDFYKDLFKKEPCSGYSLKDDFFSPEEKITETQNKTLEAPFSEEEVKEAVFGSYLDGAPGPDGFPFLFY